MGVDASVAAADLGEGAPVKRGTAAADIYQFAQAGGVFAGVSLDGFVVGPRERLNQEYYGARASIGDILITGRVDRHESHVLKDALRLETPAAPASVPTAAPAPVTRDSAETTPLRSCSPESRQAETCAQLFQPVCADIDTGVRCVRAPCDEDHALQTFSSACEACRAPKTIGYRDGACPAAR